MITGIWGKKIGMTQVFAEDDKVVPVTAIACSHWIVTNLKTEERDGYKALQVGYVRPRYAQDNFSSAWLKKPKKYFALLREVKITGDVPENIVGLPFDYKEVFTTGEYVNVMGTTRGRGFQGVVKRHGFAGGPATHGTEFGRIPGSNGHMHTRGRVIKGKRLPGRMGGKRQIVQGLQIVRVEPEAGLLLVKGAVPGKSGSFVFVKKA